MPADQIIFFVLAANGAALLVLLLVWMFMAWFRSRLWYRIRVRRDV